MKYTYNPDERPEEPEKPEDSTEDQPAVSEETTLGIDQNIVGALTYLLGWVTGIAFLFVEKENSFVRFHAIQSIVVFGSLTIATAALPFVPFVGPVLSTLLGIFGFFLWLFLVFQAFIGNRYRIPYAGDYAESHLKGMNSQ